MTVFWEMRKFQAVDDPDKILEIPNPRIAGLEQHDLDLRTQSQRKKLDALDSGICKAPESDQGDAFLDFYASFVGSESSDRLAWRSESFGDSKEK
jgi:hypothetical protein